MIANRDDYLEAARLMQSIGGGFASHIAAAFFVADKDNTQRLLEAFPELFDRYKEMARQERENRERRELAEWVAGIKSRD